MKNIVLVFYLILFHFKAFGQSIEVKGKITANSIDVSSGLIRNVANPIATQDAATKAYVDLLEAKVIALQGVKDIDNNRYDIITIGTQTWMAANLRTTRYNDGTVIPLIQDATAWSTASTNGAPAYCWYNNETANLIAYGALYNWFAINKSSNGNKNVCPTGWHVPTDGEWTMLTTFLGGVGVAGGKMKEAGLAHWLAPNTGATNASGFAGLPGSNGSFAGEFSYLGYYGVFWSSTETIATDAWNRSLYWDVDDVYKNNVQKGNGFSVRCLRD